MSYANGPKIVTDGLVLCLDAANRKSYPGSGSTWYDLSGNGNHATLNGTNFISDHLGCINIDGTDDYISIPSSSSLQMTDQITLISVFSPDAFSANKARLFDTYGNSGATGSSFALKMGTVADYKDISFFLMQSGSGFYEIKRTLSVLSSINDVYHVVARWRKSDGTSDIFINGVKQTSYSVSNSFTNTLGTLNNPITIGKLEYSPTDIYGDQQVYSSLIYNRYLSDNEISQTYNALKGRYGL